MACEFNDFESCEDCDEKYCPDQVINIQRNYEVMKQKIKEMRKLRAALDEKINADISRAKDYFERYEAEITTTVC